MNNPTSTQSSNPAQTPANSILSPPSLSSSNPSSSSPSKSRRSIARASGLGIRIGSKDWGSDLEAQSFQSGVGSGTESLALKEIGNHHSGRVELENDGIIFDEGDERLSPQQHGSSLENGINEPIRSSKVEYPSDQDEDQEDEDEDEDAEDVRDESKHLNFTSPSMPISDSNHYLRHINRLGTPQARSSPHASHQPQVHSRSQAPFEPPTSGETLYMWISIVLVTALSLVAVLISIDVIDWPGDGIGLNRRGEGWRWAKDLEGKGVKVMLPDPNLGQYIEMSDREESGMNSFGFRRKGRRR